ncbi:MAG: DNA double-strand break repair nuclease NurA [Acidimicrobiales bacterium]
MDGTAAPDPTVAAAAARLAALLSGDAGGLRETGRSDLCFEETLQLRPFERGAPPEDVWAVDGGQALVADARCLQVYVTRAARARWRGGRTVMEDEGALRGWLIGLGEERKALAALGAPVAEGSPVDVNLLRDWGEWEAVSACVEDAGAGAAVLVDGDLQPDWRIPSTWLGDLLSAASRKGVLLAGVTKHTSLSWGGRPLLGVLERRAESELGPRACWWAPVARTRPDVGAGIQVVVARLDPDARFSFRVDLAGGAEPAGALAALSALSDDAAFPGYPYPLSVADRLAACPGWIRDEAWAEIREALDLAGVPEEVTERAFADRHVLMERA